MSEQRLKIRLAVFQEVTDVRRFIKALPGNVDSVGNPGIGDSAVGRFCPDRIGLRYDEQGRCVAEICVEHLR